MEKKNHQVEGRRATPCTLHRHDILLPVDGTCQWQEWQVLWPHAASTRRPWTGIWHMSMGWTTGSFPHAGAHAIDRALSIWSMLIFIYLEEKPLRERVEVRVVYYLFTSLQLTLQYHIYIDSLSQQKHFLMLK